VADRVWLIWEDDDVLGVYADPDTAAADCTALGRYAHHNHLGVHYEYLAVPVFTAPRHRPTARRTSSPDRTRTATAGSGLHIRAPVGASQQDSVASR